MGKKYIRKTSGPNQGRNNQKKIVKRKDRFNPDFNTGFLPFLSNSETLNNSNNLKLEKHCITFNATFCNMISKYFQLRSCPYKNSPEFAQTFYNIIKQLSLDMNEFVGWTILIDQSIKENSNGYDSKHLLYLAICSKMNLLYYSEIINEYKNNKDFQKWYNLNKKIIEKGINLVEFNKRYNELRNNKKSLNIIKYDDINLIVNDLCNIINKKNKEIDRGKKDSNFLLSSNTINQNSSKNGEISIEIKNIDSNDVNNNYINIKSLQRVKKNNYKICNTLDLLKNCAKDLNESQSILSPKNESEENNSYFKINIEGMFQNDIEENDEKIDENKSFNMGENPTYLYYNNSKKILSNHF